MAGQLLEVFLKVVGAKEAQKEFAKTGDSTKALKAGLMELGGAVAGPLALAGAATALIGAGRQSIAMAQEHAKIQGQLNAVLTSTGGAAGMTAEAINQLASDLQNTTNYEDDATVAGANLLLTFTNIGKDVFPAATSTMLDMSTALGQDLKASALQLGKALNDPVAGITALKEVGVTFSDSQKEMAQSLVETGQTAAAQRIILDELGKEFGGSAAAAREADGGFAALGNALGSLGETVGTQLLPVLTPAIDGLRVFIEDIVPKIEAGSAGLQSAASNISLLSGAINDAASVNPVFQAIGSAAASAGEAISSGFSWALEEAQDKTAQFIIGQIKMTGMGDAIAASLQETNTATIQQAEVSARDAAMLKMFAASSAQAAAAQGELAQAQTAAGLAGATSRYAAQAAQYGADVVHRNAIETQQYITDTTQSLEEFKKESAASANSAASSWQSAFDQRKSAVNSAVESVLGAGFGAISDLGLNLGGEDAGRAIAEDARRLGAIAAGDFGGEAARLLEASNPELFKKVMASENPAEVAKGVLADFQMGIDTYGLIDREAAKERIRKMLFAGEQRQAIINELTQELMAEGQYSAGQIQQAIGVAIGGASETITGAVPEEQQAMITGIKTEIDNIGVSADTTGVKVSEAFVQTTDPILTLQTGLTEVVKILERVDTLAQAATGSVSGLGSSVGLPPTAPAVGPGYAEGGSFVVPPGYPNDSYPMRVSSGERVTVSTGGQSAQSVTVPVYLDGQVIAQVVSRVQGTQLNNSNRLGNAARL